MAESSYRPERGAQTWQASASRAFLTSLHPSGDPDTILARDRQADAPAAARKGDVVVLAMTAAQCRDRGTREALLDQAVAALQPEGVLWIDVPGRWRGSVAAALRRSGLATGQPT